MGILERLHNSDHPVKAVLYARFSSDNQRDESIDAQVRAIKDFAKGNNISIIGKYVDRAKSATTDDRPEFQRMIKDSSKKTFELVLVHKLDRFARNRNDAIANRVALKKNDVSLLSVTELLDEDRPESIILESVLEAMAEYYSKNLAREVRKGQKENALKGQHNGGFAPLGYNVDPATRMLVINEEEAEAVRLIFKMMLQHSGYNAILVALKERGYKTKAGKDFGKNSIYEILHNPKYKGTYVYNRVSPANPANKKRNSHKLNSEDKMIVIPNGCPAIISEEDFDAVNAILGSRSTGRRVIETYLLAGKIFCGECGARYVGNRKKSTGNRKPVVTYRCNNRARKTSIACSNKEINRNYIEQFVIDKIEEALFDKELIESIMSQFQEYMRHRDADANAEVKRLVKKVQQIDTKVNNLVEILAEVGSNAFQKGAILEKLDTLERDKASIQSKIDGEKERLESRVPTKKAIMDSFIEARRLFKSQSLEEMQQLVDQYVDKVIVYEDRVEVSLSLIPFIPVNDITKEQCSVGRDDVKNFKK